MCKIIAFFGSPRKNGYTAQLMERVLEGARSIGAEIITYNLNDDGVKGCQGCFYCRAHEGCSTKDILQPMYKDIQSANGIVAGFPIYFGAISGQGKLLLDRLYPMVGDNFAPRYPGKKVVSIFAQANPDHSLFTDAMESTNRFFNLCGWDLVESLLLYGDVAPNYTIPNELLDRAFEAGKRLAKEG